MAVPETIEGAIMDKPDVGPIEGEPPAELVIEDITVGDGPEAKSGQHVKVHYVGVAHSTGQEFDASYNRGDSFDFPLGGGQVIAGWDQGVEGMKVGGRRKLTIPPHLGYGARGAGGAIKPNETLIFVVDLLGVQ
jgi:peptidylprolyl isomerase